MPTSGTTKANLERLAHERHKLLVMFLKDKSKRGEILPKIIIIQKQLKAARGW